MAKSAHRIAFILDANVVIDYLRTDRSVLTLAANHLGRMIIAAPLIREVRGLREDDCANLGLTISSPTFGQLAEAARNRGRLSFQDWLCLLLARESGAICVTNDRPLRHACEENGVQIIWGLELMTKVAAKTIAERIHDANPRHVTSDILSRFRRRLR